MSFEWEETTLGEICKKQGGSVQTGPFGSQLHTSDYKQVGVPVVMPTNICDNGISEDGIARIDQTDVERLSQHKLLLNDIVFSRRGDVTKNALVREQEVGWFCGTGCLKVRLGNGNIANAKFISHYLRTPEIKSWLVRHAVGATMPNLNTNILSAVPIYLPPMKVQVSVAELLGAIDDRINLLRETNATLEAIAQALFKSWFVNFEPVCAKSEGKLPEGLDEATAGLFPDAFEETELGMVPRGWSSLTLSEICKVHKGCSYKGAGLSEDSGAYMFNLGCFNAPRVFALENLKRYTGEYKDRHRVSAGDLIVANTDMTQHRAILGRPLIVPTGFQHSFVSHHVFRLELLNSGMHSMRNFLFFEFQQPEFRKRAIGYATGTTVLALPKDVLEGFRLTKPTDQVLAKFNEIANPLFDSILQNEHRVQTLIELRNALLPRLISGRLRIADAEAELEKVTA